MPRRKVTTEESEPIFRHQTENSIRYQVAEFAARTTLATMEAPDDERIRAYNKAVMRWLRDHHRAAGSHYAAMLEQYEQEDKG